ncbi:MAG: ThiF family adenylyltransferase [Candidatus Thermoplasmatota archaeon]
MKKKVVLEVGYIDKDKYERAKRLKWLDFKKINKTKVLVVGAGALGNEVCKNLVLSGFKNISLVDMDYIVKSNLNRCILFTNLDAEKRRLKAVVVGERIKEIDDSVNIKCYTKKIEELGEKFIPAHDIVIGCVDNIATRLHLNAHCYYHRIPYIDGGMDGLIGKVQVVVPPKTSCIECNLNKTHMKILDLRFSCTGENITFFENKLAAEITTTSIIAAIQVREALKLVNKCGEVIKHLLYYDGYRNVCDTLELEINPNCMHHGKMK